MTTTIIISICVLLLLAYVFDISSSKTKIPSVILLLTVGWLVRQGAVFFQLNVPDLSSILPILGTVGLILIVLEGSLELELNKSKLGFIGKTVLISFLPMLLFCFGLAAVFQYFGHISFKDGLANAIPFGVISSAIAIPSVQNLISKDKEFITYESSLSDIFGVIFFNFITLNDNIGTPSVGHFIIELLIILLVTFVATIGLAFLLSKIKHHVKFLPIILIIVLIYAVSKIYHLPGLIFILLFGLFIGNLDELKNYKFIQKLQPENLNKEVHKFKELTSETAFLIRSLFFLLFGYLIETHELINQETIIWAVAITLSILVLRFIFLKLFNQNIKPLLFIAPRGLITILLFLSIPINQVTSLANKSLILQVIILTAILMMIGLMSNKTKTLEKTVEADI
ncbi:cation:proton antiporter [Lacihabitans sp. CS3-21]|uniref:cation:proton antiporter n=1 Tax=Lacihabitans sp. CS3-21 TaxID=2487332 RepID=UPI0020CDB6E3|nr:cation:proton antiporter [Lacihabitans sp. CS3-21]MCP9747225.1 sodium:proton antiporter [Lacihabitans sp. CS3-21]